MIQLLFYVMLLKLTAGIVYEEMMLFIQIFVYKVCTSYSSKGLFVFDFCRFAVLMLINWTKCTRQGMKLFLNHFMQVSSYIL